MNKKSQLPFKNSEIDFLPNKFQEMLISLEIQLKKEPNNISCVQKLLYLYSMGTEYYDSQNKTEISQYYIDKTTSLITDTSFSNLLQEDVKIDNENTFKDINKNFLQNKPSTKNSKISQMKLSHPKNFNLSIPINENCNNEGTKHYEENKLIFEKLEILTSDEIPKTSRLLKTKSINNDEIGKTHNETHFDLTAFKPIKTKELNYIKRKKKECEDSIVDQQIKNEFKILDIKLNNVEDTIMSELSKQSALFEENRLKKLKRKKINDNSIIPIKKSSINKGRRGSKIEGIFESLSCTQKGQYDIMKDILEYSEKQARLNQEKANKEIEEFITKNTNEMNEAVEEIKFSYSEDMKEIDENVFPEIIEQLKSDMLLEINLTKEKYEDSKCNNIEKIKAKYKID